MKGAFKKDARPCKPDDAKGAVKKDAKTSKADPGPCDQRTLWDAIRELFEFEVEWMARAEGGGEFTDSSIFQVPVFTLVFGGRTSRPLFHNFVNSLSLSFAVWMRTVSYSTVIVLELVVQRRVNSNASLTLPAQRF